MKKFILGLIFIIGAIFFFVPIITYRPNCVLVVIEGQPSGCEPYKITSFKYFFQEPRGTIKDLIYNYKYDKAREKERLQQEQELN